MGISAKSSKRWLIGRRMKTKHMKADLFEDRRGAIHSFPLLDNTVKEYNLMITKQGDQRGFHYHPHFDEYMLVVEGECQYTEFSPDGNHSSIIMRVGDSIHIPSNVAHAFTALTDFKFVSMLTERWDDSHPPIVKVDAQGREMT